MGMTNPSPQGAAVAALLRAEAALWKEYADAVRGAMHLIPNDAVTGRESNIDGKSDSDQKTQDAVADALKRASSTLALAEAAYASRMASAVAWESHVHPENN